MSEEKSKGKSKVVHYLNFSTDVIPVCIAYSDKLNTTTDLSKGEL